MARPRNWDALKDSYRRKLERAGITRAKYESGVSLKQARGHGPVKNTPSSIASLSLRQQETRNRALKALSDMRRAQERGEPITFADAARGQGIATETLLRYAGQGFERKGGRYLAKPSDRVIRAMVMVTTEGQRTVYVTSRQASRIGKHLNAIARFADSDSTNIIAAEKNLASFAPDVIGGYRFETRPEELAVMLSQGTIKFDEVYRVVR